jgi:predicted dehydrogenase
MKIALIGYGIQGKKRLKVAGKDIACIVDPVSPFANFKKIQDVPIDKYEAAYVCTPDKEKFPIINYLIKNGKHILCEKPLYLDTAGRFADFQNKINRKNIVLYTAYNHRFEPSIMKTKEIIQSKKLGKIYSVKLFYGNGTAKDILNSDWRDLGSGVLLDLGSHLFDFIDYLFEKKKFDFKVCALDKFENKAPDHVILVSTNSNPRIELNATFCMWKNTFTCDIIGSKGSLHLNGLTKWGKSSLTLRRRVFPSGKPLERKINYKKGDLTWKSEYDHFNQLIKNPKKIDLRKDKSIFVKLGKISDINLK